MTSSGICFGAEHKQRCSGCFSSLRYPPFKKKDKLQFLDSFKVSLQAKQCQEPYYVQIYSRPAFVSQPADTGTITNSRRVFSLDAWDFFFFSMDAGNHYIFQIYLSKENVTFIKKTTTTMESECSVPNLPFLIITDA